VQRKLMHIGSPRKFPARWTPRVRPTT
jgi:hypothetical protein